jgi:biopolymer transport protein ExbD
MHWIRVCELSALSLALAGCAARPKPAVAAPPAAAPAASAASPESAPPSSSVVHVEISADGQMFVDFRPEPNLDAVAAAVERGHAGALDSLRVVLEADKSAAAARLIGVIDRLKRDGLKRFALAVAPPPPPSAQPSATAPPAGSSAPAAAAAPPAPSLPEVSVRNIGLHIGGGPNDDASKEPFRKAIEPHFDDFLKCYRQAEKPEKGGVFGVDLYVGRHGGKPEVRQPRTAMKGKAFRDCMVQAFANIDFLRPKKPTVFSYSLRFKLGSR